MSAHGRRRRRVLGLAKGCRNLVATTTENIFYLTHFWGSALAIVKEDRTVLLTTPLESGRAKDTAEEAEVIEVPASDQLWRAASRHLSPGRVAADVAMPSVRAESARNLFLRARRRKDDEEISRIRSASQKLDLVVSHIAETIAPGQREREVAGEAMKSAMVEGLTPLGGGASLSPIIVASGSNGSYPHAEVSDRRLRAGEFVTVDIFFRFEGYCSDLTRTFALGRTTEEMRGAYDSVLRAQQEGIGMVRPGRGCAALHRRVTEELRRAGVERYFTHGTGHGVGIDIHELPSVGRASKERLSLNDVVTVEPGVYVPGRFGIRIEDTVLVGEKAAVLTRYPTELRVVG